MRRQSTYQLEVAKGFEALMQLNSRELSDKRKAIAGEMAARHFEAALTEYEGSSALKFELILRLVETASRSLVKVGGVPQAVMQLVVENARYSVSTGTEKRDAENAILLIDLIGREKGMPSSSVITVATVAAPHLDGPPVSRAIDAVASAVSRAVKALVLELGPDRIVERVIRDPEFESGQLFDAAWDFARHLNAPADELLAWERFLVIEDFLTNDQRFTMLKQAGRMANVVARRADNAAEFETLRAKVTGLATELYQMLGSAVDGGDIELDQVRRSGRQDFELTDQEEIDVIFNVATELATHQPSTSHWVEDLSNALDQLIEAAEQSEDILINHAVINARHSQLVLAKQRALGGLQENLKDEYTAVGVMKLVDDALVLYAEYENYVNDMTTRQEGLGLGLEAVDRYLASKEAHLIGRACQLLDEFEDFRSLDGPDKYTKLAMISERLQSFGRGQVQQFVDVGKRIEANLPEMAGVGATPKQGPGIERETPER